MMMIQSVAIDQKTFSPCSLLQPTRSIEPRRRAGFDLAELVNISEAQLNFAGEIENADGSGSFNKPNFGPIYV